MRNTLNNNKYHDSRINYRGKSASRIENLTDAVFGIAITLLIFSLTNPNSFSDLILFAKSLPAFLLSITFLILIWKEHLSFSEVYTLNDFKLTVLNTLFIALVIFYVYPLRFLTIFLTNIYFQTNISINIKGEEVPYLIIYYGFFAFALYFTLFLFYKRAYKLKDTLELNEFELFYTKMQTSRTVIMFGVPLISILITFILKEFSEVWASMIGGFAYGIYTPLMIYWHKKYKNQSKKYK